MTQYEKFIHISRYSRWNDEECRRETWEETVGRYVDFMKSWLKLDNDICSEILRAISNREVMPSMRCLMTAGPALERDHAAAFNCSALNIDCIEAFDEMMYLLMVGCGVGFSVEDSTISKLPKVPNKIAPSNSTIVVEDNRIGWCEALREFMGMLWNGRSPRWDVSKIRPAGTRLKVFGGLASGPAVLESLFRFIATVFNGARGRKLSSIECHDICCKIAEVVVSGGVRRSATISISDRTDDKMRDAKTGGWYNTHPWRCMANNSAIYNGRPDMMHWIDEWGSLVKSRSGERGILNRQAFKTSSESIGRDSDHEFLVNPCGEIILRPCQQCNLTEVIIREDDDIVSLKRKVRIATILGTMQATLTNFSHLRPIWRQNAEEEALLGVSLTGIMDNALMSGVYGRGELVSTLEQLRSYTREVNAEWANKFGINSAAAITTVKPSGTVSQLCGTSSGIHPRYSQYYIRRVQQGIHDPVSRLLIEEGVPYEYYKMNPSMYVFSFPVKSPQGARTVSNVSSKQQLELWKIYRKYWTDHQPSISVYVRDDDWLGVGDWVYKNFNIVGGLSFFPYDDHVYEQAPYEAITEERYNELASVFPSIDWDKLSQIEKNADAVTATREFACSGGGCEIN